LVACLNQGIDVLSVLAGTEFTFYIIRFTYRHMEINQDFRGALVGGMGKKGWEPLL